MRHAACDGQRIKRIEKEVMNQKKYAVFTMDVETFADTECIQNVGYPVDLDLMDGFDEYIRILDRYGIKSTLFTLGNLASPFTERLKAHLANGHRLALHNYDHVAPMSVSVEQFRENLLRAKDRMRKLFNVDVTGFRAPCFSMDRARLDVLQELGFRYDSSHLNFLSARHTVDLDLQDYQSLRPGIFRNQNFYEFGLSNARLGHSSFPVSGGGYVRMVPWPAIRMLLRQYIRNHDYYVFYLHPFELTRQKVPLIKGLKGYDQYYIRQGIRSYGKRIERIIRMLQKHGYEFVTFEQLMQNLDAEAPATN